MPHKEKDWEGGEKETAEGKMTKEDKTEIKIEKPKDKRNPKKAEEKFKLKKSYFICLQAPVDTSSPASLPRFPKLKVSVSINMT